MAGSAYGNLFSVTTWGESHGKAIGAVVEGCPAGLSLCEEDLIPFLARRKPGQSSYTTMRQESDSPQILSGTFGGRTTGTPISVLVPNQDQRSHDYSDIKDCFRPGHADYTWQEKYGIRDYTGGGRSSGRETIGRVIGGAIAAKALSDLSISLMTYTKAIGDISVPEKEYDYEYISKSPLYMPSSSYSAKAETFLRSCMEDHDSSGGVIECCVTGMPVGIGEPVFQKLDALLASAVMSVGAVKAVEIGDGCQVSSSLGSENNDPFFSHDGHVYKKTNHSGGILGGISDGSPIILRAHVKPTPSISCEQQTVSTDKENTTLTVRGRHDPVIVPRAVVVVESMVAITLLDLLKQNMSAKISSMKRFYHIPDTYGI